MVREKRVLQQSSRREPWLWAASVSSALGHYSESLARLLRAAAAEIDARYCVALQAFLINPLPSALYGKADNSESDSLKHE